MKKAIFLYDYTGIIAKPWLEAGYQCWSFDGQHPKGITVDGNHIKVGMWFNAYSIFNNCDSIVKLVGEGVYFIFGFPECTDLSVSGAAHFENKRLKNKLFQYEAIQLAQLVRLVGDSYKCKWAFENPVSVISTMWRKPDFSFHPYEYGGYLSMDDVHPTYPKYIKPRDAYPKKTCIWCGNGFIEPIKKIVNVDDGYSLQHNKLGGKSLNTKNIRSATPRGFALAVFDANKGMT